MNRTARVRREPRASPAEAAPPTARRARPSTVAAIAAVADVADVAPPPLLRLSREDARQAWMLFLGAEPPAVPTGAAQFATAPDLTSLLSTLLSSEEFRTEVLQPLLLRESFPSRRFEGTPPLRLIDWAQKHVPIETATARACGLARNWAGLLTLLLADARLAQLTPDLVASGVVGILRTRIAADPHWSEPQAVIGAVDSASAFEVRGWAVDLCDKSRPVALEFFADGAFLGTVRCEQPRPDVADVVGGEGAVGFTFRIASAHRAAFVHGCTITVVDAVLRRPIAPGIPVHAEPASPSDAIADARREIAQLRQALARIESQLPQLHQMASLPLEAYGEYWERFYRPAPDILHRQRLDAAAFAYRPLVSVVLPAYRSDPALLDRAIASVRAQSYEHWELIVSDDATPDPSEFAVVQRRHAAETRIQWLLAKERGGIARNTNRAIAGARGEYVAFLDHDDELAPDALYRCVAALQNPQDELKQSEGKQQPRRYRLIYSDEDRIEVDDYGRCAHHTPYFKPDFDPDLLLSMNYICHLVVAERALLDAAGGLRAGVDGAQDHDLLLRLTRSLTAKEVLHIPRVLYHWRVTPGSASRTPETQQALRQTIVNVVDEHLRAMGRDAVVETHDDPVGRPRLFANRVRWRLPKPAPTVSIVIPTRDRRDLLEPCVESIRRTAPLYPGPVEVLLVDNDSTEPATLAYLEQLAAAPSMQAVAGIPAIRVLTHPGKFNWSAINNAAARHAHGEVLVFLNNDTVVLTPDWCQELVANALRPEVGAVGARLLYQDGTIQHAGVLVGVEGVAGHESVGEPPANGGYFGRTHLARATSAVTGACIATRRELFLELGGFDELELKVAFNDVDFCMKARAAGYRVLYTPFATLYHFESKSRGRELTAAQQERFRGEARAFRARWGEQVGSDPYYNPHFERYARPFERLRPPPE